MKSHGKPSIFPWVFPWENPWFSRGNAQPLDLPSGNLWEATHRATRRLEDAGDLDCSHKTPMGPLVFGASYELLMGITTV